MTRTQLMDLILVSIAALTLSLIFNSCTGTIEKKSPDAMDQVKRVRYEATLDGCREGIEVVYILETGYPLELDGKSKVLEICNHYVQTKFMENSGEFFE